MRRRGRRSRAGDERDRLLHVLPDVDGCFLLGAPANLAHQDDRFRVRVLVEHAHGLDLAGADDQVATDADAGALPDTLAGELRDHFVDERA